MRLIIRILPVLVLAAVFTSCKKDCSNMKPDTTSLNTTVTPTKNVYVNKWVLNYTVTIKQQQESNGSFGKPTFDTVYFANNKKYMQLNADGTFDFSYGTIKGNWEITKGYLYPNISEISPEMRLVKAKGSNEGFPFVNNMPFMNSSEDVSLGINDASNVGFNLFTAEQAYTNGCGGITINYKQISHFSNSTERVVK